MSNIQKKITIFLTCSCTCMMPVTLYTTGDTTWPHLKKKIELKQYFFSDFITQTLLVWLRLKIIKHVFYVPMWWTILVFIGNTNKILVYKIELQTLYRALQECNLFSKHAISHLCGKRSMKGSYVNGIFKEALIRILL